MRVLFWGTPEFAAAPLRALIGEGFEVVGVVSQPDKPQGRAREIIPAPVKQIAMEEEIPVFQPKNARDPELLETLSVIKPDISVVVAYGHILPKNIIDLPRMGTLNIHASLLPALRGAGPIQGAIRQGLSETGVSVMRVVPALDAVPAWRARYRRSAAFLLDDVHLAAQTDRTTADRTTAGRPTAGRPTAGRPTDPESRRHFPDSSR